MDFIYFSTLSFNGFDEISHYLRAAVIVNTCSSYAVDIAGACEGHFTPTKVIRSSSSAAADEEAVEDPAATLRSSEPAARAVGEEPLPQVPAPEGPASRAPSGLDESSEPMLEYLLGSDGE